MFQSQHDAHLMHKRTDIFSDDIDAVFCACVAPYRDTINLRYGGDFPIIGKAFYLCCDVYAQSSCQIPVEVGSSLDYRVVFPERSYFSLSYIVRIPQELIGKLMQGIFCLFSVFSFKHIAYFCIFRQGLDSGKIKSF